jgi:transcriptional regulator with XRE-family HTH domain
MSLSNPLEVIEMDVAKLRHTFSSRIRKLRGEKLNQGEFADSVGISRGAMSYYEQEARTPDIGVLRAICVKYNISADYLLGIIPDPNHQVSDVCRETALSPESAQKLRILSRVLAHPPEDTTLTTYKDMFAFTSVPKVLNILLENDEGLAILNLLGAIIIGAEIDTGSESAPMVKLKSAVKGIEISFPLENLTAALWVNIQNSANDLKGKLQRNSAS